MKAIYDKYVHEFTDEHGKTRYAVCEWDEYHSQYVCPVDKRTSRIYGNSAYFSKYPSYFGGYETRQEALRRARYLFGDK